MFAEARRAFGRAEELANLGEFALALEACDEAERQLTRLKPVDEAALGKLRLTRARALGHSGRGLEAEAVVDKLLAEVAGSSTQETKFIRARALAFRAEFLELRAEFANALATTKEALKLLDDDLVSNAPFRGWIIAQQARLCRQLHLRTDEIAAIDQLVAICRSDPSIASFDTVVSELRLGSLHYLLLNRPEECAALADFNIWLNSRNNQDIKDVYTQRLWACAAFMALCSYKIAASRLSSLIFDYTENSSDDRSLEVIIFTMYIHAMFMVYSKLKSDHPRDITLTSFPVDADLVGISEILDMCDRVIEEYRSEAYNAKLQRIYILARLGRFDESAKNISNFIDEYKNDAAHFDQVNDVYRLLILIYTDMGDRKNRRMSEKLLASRRTSAASAESAGLHSWAREALFGRLDDQAIVANNVIALAGHQPKQSGGGGRRSAEFSISHISEYNSRTTTRPTQLPKKAGVRWPGKLHTDLTLEQFFRRHWGMYMHLKPRLADIRKRDQKLANALKLHFQNRLPWPRDLQLGNERTELGDLVERFLSSDIADLTPGELKNVAAHLDRRQKLGSPSKPLKKRGVRGPQL